MKKYISNTGGLEYYYQERKLEINLKDNQEIIDKEYDKIGYLINIINLNDYISPYKFKNLDDIMINGVKEASPMNVFENLLNESKFSNNNLSKNNYGNNHMNK